MKRYTPIEWRSIFFVSIMEDALVKVKKKKKTGPLKSSPGFLKCMRSVYLYFKEEKEKGALNIPINSFIERTAVACGVGRKTLYNYAKKGLFNEHPTILQAKKKKKKRPRPTSVSNGAEEDKDRIHSGKSSQHLVAPKKKIGRSVQVQTQNSIFLENNITDTGLNELLTKEDKTPKSTSEVGGPWAGGNSARRDIDYFTKTNIWQNVYSINASDVAACSTELAPARMGNCQPTSSDLTDL